MGHVGGLSAFASDVERIAVNQTSPDPALGDDRSEYLGGANPHPFLTFTPIPQAMSIDRARIAEQLYGFSGRPACNLVVAPARYSSSAHDGCLSQDIQGARTLLDNAGVLDTDGDGIREYRGIPLKVTYQTTVNAVRQATQALVRDWWREIGIETELPQHDAAVFFGGDPVVDRGYTYRRFFADVQMYTGGPSIDPQQYLSGWSCGHIQQRENNWANGNNSRACNETYDQALAQLSRTMIGPERDQLVQRLNDIAVQDFYEIPLVTRGLVSAHANPLVGVGMNAWNSELWNIDEWMRR